MLARFSGSNKTRLLIDSLRSQKLFGGSRKLAVALSPHVRLRKFARNDVIIRQDEDDNDLYLILSGTVTVLVNGRRVAMRRAGEHVGEMSLIDPSARRSATVVAADSVLVARVSERDFARIAAKHPELWRAIARELSARLRQRGQFHAAPNAKPLAFVGSSSEALPIAAQIRDGLCSPRIEARLWTEGVFQPSNSTMEDLEKQLALADFAVLVAAAEDLVTSRRRRKAAPRDNVIFELGLFMGALSRQRAFLLVPKAIELKIPSDLLGITTIRYGVGRGSTFDLSLACKQLKGAIGRLGPR